MPRGDAARIKGQVYREAKAMGYTLTNPRGFFSTNIQVFRNYIQEVWNPLSVGFDIEPITHPIKVKPVNTQSIKRASGSHEVMRTYNYSGVHDVKHMVGDIMHVMKPSSDKLRYRVVFNWSNGIETSTRLFDKDEIEACVFSAISAKEKE